MRTRITFVCHPCRLEWAVDVSGEVATVCPRCNRRAEVRRRTQIVELRGVGPDR